VHGIADYKTYGYRRSVASEQAENMTEEPSKSARLDPRFRSGFLFCLTIFHLRVSIEMVAQSRKIRGHHERGHFHAYTCLLKFRRRVARRPSPETNFVPHPCGFQGADAELLRAKHRTYTTSCFHPSFRNAGLKPGLYKLYFQHLRKNGRRACAFPITPRDKNLSQVFISLYDGNRGRRPNPPSSSAAPARSCNSGSCKNWDALKRAPTRRLPRKT